MWLYVQQNNLKKQKRITLCDVTYQLFLPPCLTYRSLEEGRSEMIEAPDETLRNSGMNEIYFFRSTYKKTISKLAKPAGQRSGSKSYAM